MIFSSPVESRPRGRGFEPHRRHCVVSLSKNINPSLVLVQTRKTSPFITERLLMGIKLNKQTKHCYLESIVVKLTSHKMSINRGSYIHAHVLLNLLNEMGKRDKM